MQGNLKTLEDDINKITKLLQKELSVNKASNAARTKWNRLAFLLFFVALTVVTTFLPLFYLDAIDGLVDGEITKLVPQAKTVSQTLTQFPSLPVYVIWGAVVFIIIAKVWRNYCL